MNQTSQTEAKNTDANQSHKSEAHQSRGRRSVDAGHVIAFALGFGQFPPHERDGSRHTDQDRDTSGNASYSVGHASLMSTVSLGHSLAIVQPSSLRLGRPTGPGQLDSGIDRLICIYSQSVEH